MPRYRYVYRDFRHGERHPDDEAALEAVDEAKRTRGLIRVERVDADSATDVGGSAPHCRADADAFRAEIIWEA